MAVRRRAAIGTALASAVLAAACSSSASGPLHRVTARTSTTTTTVATTTTTTSTLPSAVPTTIPSPVVAAAGWSQPLTALPPAGGFTSVSCISDVFCLAAGGGSNQADAADSTGPGVVDSWDGAAWAPPATYFATGSGAAPPPWMPAISCTDGPLCAVADGSGHTTLGNGTDWSPPTPLAPTTVPPVAPVDPGPGHAGARTAGISCPSAQFCAYVDNTGHVATMHGTTWSTPLALTTGAGTTSVELFQSGRVGVSCTDTSSCTAMVGDTTVEWNGTTWSTSGAPWGAGTTSGDTAVSCPASGTCVAVHGSSVSVRMPGTTWASPQVIDAGGQLDSVSCPSVGNCVAADTAGRVVRLASGTWGAPTKVVPGPASYPGDGATVSCPSAQFCMVLTGDGDYATYQATPAGGV